LEGHKGGKVGHVCNQRQVDNVGTEREFQEETGEDSPCFLDPPLPTHAIRMLDEYFKTAGDRLSTRSVFMQT
jgi:hypothetical protein